MEDGTRIPSIETAKPSRRSFLLTVIFLLATLILSSLCVISLLILEPRKESSAAQTGASTNTPIMLETEVSPSLLPNPTPDHLEPASIEIPPSEAPAGARRIIVYSEPSMGVHRIIVYIEETQGARRIITYGDDSSSSPPATETPHSPRRIISYSHAD